MRWAPWPTMPRCWRWPSIVNLLAKDGENKPAARSDSDLGYLRGLYTMSADARLRMQKDGIAYRMRQQEKAK